MKILIKDAFIVTMNKDFSKFIGNIMIEEGKISKVTSEPITGVFDKVINAKGRVVLPGFIQPHVHLCQTLFRGTADDLELLDWLKKRIWPLEGAHDEESIYYSAKLGLCELIKSGTTSIIDMETVHYTDSAINAIYESGERCITGKVMMDYGGEVPESLMENKNSSISESIELLKKWHGKDGGRIQYAFTPRFAVSCTDELLREVARLSKEYDVRVHTHASENRGEIAFVEADRGMRNVLYLKNVGLLGENTILAHCIWIDNDEMNVIKETGTKVVHCPSSNLKLASGIAKIPELMDMGIDIGIAADGAPCNNNLDIFMEMRLSALIQKVRLGPKVMDCRKVLYLATMGGAKVMGMENSIGSIEEGKNADVVIMNLNKVHNAPVFYPEIESQIVFAAKSENVETVIVNGQFLMENGRLITINEKETIKKSNECIERLCRKIKI